MLVRFCLVRKWAMIRRELKGCFRIFTGRDGNIGILPGCYCLR